MVVSKFIFCSCLIILFHALAASGRLVVEDVGRTVDPNVTLKDTANGLPQNDLEEGHQDNQKEEEWLLDVKKVEKKQAAPLSSEMEPAIGFFEAWRIPGVATFAFCLFFSKLVAYTFLYWLPFYIRHTRGCSLSAYPTLDWLYSVKKWTWMLLL